MPKFKSDQISVVIPSVARPELRAAIDSALAQTSAVGEILVCLDCTDDVSTIVPMDERVKVLRVGPRAGGNAARQLGIREAQGSLIALLDDDDVWLPNKTETQVELLNSAVLGKAWIATSRLVANLPSGDEVWPGHLIAANEPISHYIFRKHRPRGGIGFVQASTLIFPRDLAVTVPFDETLPFHQDIDWLLSVEQHFGEVDLIQSPAPLVEYRVNASSVSKSISPQASVEWAKKRITTDRRSLGDFILTTSVLYACRTGHPLTAVRTALQAFRLGRPGGAAAVFAAYSIVSSFFSVLRTRLRPPRSAPTR